MIANIGPILETPADKHDRLSEAELTISIVRIQSMIGIITVDTNFVAYLPSSDQNIQPMSFDFYSRIRRILTKSQSFSIEIVWMMFFLI